MATLDTAQTETAGSAHRTRSGQGRLKVRYAAERRYQAYGLLAIMLGLSFLVMLFASIISKGWTAFLQSKITLDVNLDPAELTRNGELTEQSLRLANYDKLARQALYEAIGLPENAERVTRRKANALLSRGIDFQIREFVSANPSMVGQTVPLDLLAHGDVDALLKGSISRETPSARRQVDDQQVAWIDQLVAEGRLTKHFNTGLFTFGASSQPETAGLLVAILGSFFMMLVVVLLAVPLGVAAAVYLEEFAPKNWLTDIIEVNINNLAAVPSIVFGLLGLAVFINFFGLPRSASVIGGLC